MSINEKTSPLRLLVVIASYGTANNRYLTRLIAEYKSMDFATDIVVCSNIERQVPDGVEVVVGMPSRDRWSLPFSHKAIFAERANRYDLFIYSEDDTLATQEQIEAFLHVSNALSPGEIAGFLRYERCPDGTIRYCDVNGHAHWDPASVVQRGEYTLAFFSNEHAAFYILTNAQLNQAIQSGYFLVAPHHGKYDLACTAATDPYTQCGFRKLICISHLSEFVLHHLPDKYINTRFGTSEHLFGAQVQALLKLDSLEAKQLPLVTVETKLRDAWYSKDYYEPVTYPAVANIPDTVESVLSIGCTSGETERFLARQGARVTAVCIDPVIAACARGSFIDTITGDIDTVREHLTHRRFDCVYFSKILHLARNPESMFSIFAELLAPGGICLVVGPNLMTPKNIIGKFFHNHDFRNIGRYEHSGTSLVRVAHVRKWFQSQRIAVTNVAYIISDRKKRLARRTLGTLDALLADEMIVAGRKAQPSPAGDSKELQPRPEIILHR